MSTGEVGPFCVFCPLVNIIEGLELFLMSLVCPLWVNLHAPLPSVWLFLALTLSLSSVPFHSLPSHTHPPTRFASLLIPLHSASFEEVRLLNAWRNKSDLWMGQPTWVLEGEASGSQALWSSNPLFPPASLQGKLLCLSCFWSFTVPYCCRMLPLSDSQNAHILMHCSGTYKSKTIFSKADIHTQKTNSAYCPRLFICIWPLN